MDRFADAIKKIGPESVIMSTDLGQAANEPPTDGFAAFMAAMRERGITSAQVDLMTKRNPARLLGLSE